MSSCINHFSHLFLVEFVIEIVRVSRAGLYNLRLVVFRAELDIQHGHHHANDAERHQVEVGEGGGNETEIEERHQVAGAHHVNHHCVTDHDDHAAGDVQAAGDHFRDRVEQGVYPGGADRDGDNDRRDGDTHRLQQQGADMDPANGAQAAALRCAIRRVLERHGKATNQVVYRILIFYIGSLTVLLSLYPWGQVVEGGSPFVLIFHALNSNLVATVLNVVVLTAALSVYNSGVYANSRMLFGLASQGNAPKALTRVNKRGVPVLSIALSALITSIGVLINYLMPGKAFELLMALVVSTLVINWVMICLAHLKFRAAKTRQGVIPSFKALWYPFGNYLCLAFLGLILVIMYFSEGIRISVLLMPLWVAVLWCGFMLTRRKDAKR